MENSQYDPVAKELLCTTRRLMGVALFSGIVNVLTFSGSIYMLQVYDRVIPSRDLATLVGLSIIVLCAYLFQGYFDAVRMRMLARVGSLFDINLQPPIFMALATLPLQGVNAILAQQPLRDIDQIRMFLSGMGPTAFLDLPWTPLFLIALFLFHPVIGGLAGLGMLVIIGMTILTEYQSRGPAKCSMEANANRQVIADAARQNAEVIRALGMTRQFAAKWAETNELYIKENLRSMDTYANYGASAKVLRYAIQSSILGAGAYLVVLEQASGGIIIASSIILGRALAPIEVALANWKQLIAARQGLGRLRDILKITSDLSRPNVVLPRPSQSLTVEALSVKPPASERIVISGATFSLSAGDGLALLGPSASGKSSLAKALIGLWPAASGKVRLDNATLDQWHYDQLGQYIGYLPQDVALFDGTVAENIARFKERASSKAIIAAAQCAGVHEMILQLPHGYSTRVGDRGMALSAGQRQRIGLARAVFGDPFLVVLDEPNANLDTEGENRLLEAIATVRAKGAIVVAVSHRPSALAALDYAMQLNSGKILAFGPRDTVIARVQRSAWGRAISPVDENVLPSNVYSEGSR